MAAVGDTVAVNVRLVPVVVVVLDAVRVVVVDVVLLLDELELELLESLPSDPPQLALSIATATNNPSAIERKTGALALLRVRHRQIMEISGGVHYANGQCTCDVARICLYMSGSDTKRWGAL